MDTTLRTKPLPTLPQRRRIVRECLAKVEAELDQFARLAAGPHFSARAAAATRAKVRSAKTELRTLEKALAYLGQPDPRLDLYRLFGMDLPNDGKSGP